MRTRVAALLALSTIASTSSPAWESTCRQYPDTTRTADQLAATDAPPCSPDAGPNVARQRWVGPLDEHRQLFELTRAKAGLPASLSANTTLRVFTGGTASLAPVSFDVVTGAAQRTFTPGELAQLPDFSYALWDWASGNETCPLPDISSDAAECHDFATHMGPVNSNHFLPQAGAFYSRYHGIAFNRARECRVLQTNLAATGGRFDDVVAACEIEALSIEAVGQHYLQDAWSMGHMWQRWGSPDLADFPGATSDDKRDRAVLVALVSGLVHGSRGVLQKLPEWAGLDVNDAMCAPGDGVEMRLGDGQVVPGLGDDYLDELNPSSEQARRFFSCAASGMLEVYTASGMIHGAPIAPDPSLSTVDLTTCFDQRATNTTMLRAAALDVKVAGQQITLPVDSRLASFLLPKVARQSGQVPVAPALRNELRLSLQRTVSIARIRAAQDPDGTDIADGRLGDFLGAQPNGSYVTGLASYEDPSLPWPRTADVGADARARALVLARMFHRAHAADWCATQTAADLAALAAHASDSALVTDAHAAACEACAEITERSLRVGVDATNYDASAEPLCTFLTGSPAYVYEAGPGAPADLARAHCGC